MRTEKTNKSRPVKPAVQRERMRGYRERMRAAGLRQISLWVPDMNSPVVREEARRQALAASCAPGDRDTLDFIESAADTSDWT
jgi:DNA-binding LacI/PurR family transcriptional regulator